MYKKKIINVPANIRYINDWKEFLSNIDELPCIIDKQITGCGFTEWCLRNELNIILCSPRRVLIENKEGQHPDEVLYAKNENEGTITYDKNVQTVTKAKNGEESSNTSESINHLKTQVKTWALHKISGENKPCKILVTYDSFRFVKDALEEDNIFNNFLVVIDEFQSIFVDSRFKSSTELDLLVQLKDVQNVMYVSATPMIDDYLVELDEFKDLPYYSLDWGAEDPCRIVSPDIDPRKIHNNMSIVSIADDIINSYRSGNYDKLGMRDSEGNNVMVYSKEAVFYVNSVKNICDIIKKSKLTTDEINILCANTKDNIKKLRQALGLKKNDELEIGKVPKKGEPHKMFTLCTRTVYLGADFYSTCAKTYVFSDANIDSLSLDITLDLPQILGRQRLDENPWKNRAILYYKLIRSSNEETVEEFKKRVDEKISNTEGLLGIYDDTRDAVKNLLAVKYENDAKYSNYRNDYVAVNKHCGQNLKPVFNKLVFLADKRAYEIQQLDFKDRFSVLCRIKSSGNTIANQKPEEVEEFLDNFNSHTRFTERMEVFCKTRFSSKENLELVINELPAEFKNYVLYLTPEKILSVGCQKSKLDKFLNDILNNDVVSEIIYKEFEVGKRYTCSDAKNMLTEIYKRTSYNESPKASELANYFDIKYCNLTISGKRVRGFEIISKRE